MSRVCGSAGSDLRDYVCRVPSDDMVSEVYNRPGLSAIDYRCGTHGRFKQAMTALLSSHKYPALRGLTTRDRDDFAIALLDSWATVADVLTFYQERIANESYLDTAVERLSIQKLARLIGYELSPGVASDTYLTFKVENPPGIYPHSFPQLPGTFQVESVPVPIEKGIKVQSIPDPGESPVVYETVEDIAARAEWNEIKPRLTLPQTLSPDMDCIYLKGLSTNVKPGDRLLVVTADKKTLMDVTEASAITSLEVTRIKVLRSPNNGLIFGSIISCMPLNMIVETANSCDTGVFGQEEALTEGVIASLLQHNAWDGMAVLTLASTKNWPIDAMARAFKFRNALLSAAAEGTGVYLMGHRAALFGHNAPKYGSVPSILREGGTDAYGKQADAIYDQPWDEKKIDSEYVDLDNVYPSISKDSYVVLKTPDKYHAYRITDVAEITRNDYTLTAKVTRLKLDEKTDAEKFSLKETEALAQSACLEIAEVPIEEPVRGNYIMLDGPYLDLKAGKKAILTGKRLDLKGVISSELLTVKEIKLIDGYTTLYLEKPLEHSYIRDSATINANVAYATHGESVTDLLGSGDAGQAYQRFSLRQGPLTYVKSSQGGTSPSLEISVNDVLWEKVDSLYGRGPGENVYMLRNEDDGRTIIEFGDGEMGARLPTGSGNVRASYRKGIGMGGMVKAGRLKMLMTRPTGVKDVDNPLDANIGADKESGNNTRMNVPLMALTLDRIVSLRDYEDFSRATAGIAKALATWTWDGERRGVFITIAGPGSTTIKPDDLVYKGLLGSLRYQGDPYVHVSLGNYRSVQFKLTATITLDPSTPSDIKKGVKDKVREALITAFSFDARSFGQPVALSEVEAVIQAVPGVAMVDVDLLSAGGQDGLASPIVAYLPELGDTGMIPAELLTIDVNSLKLEVST